MTDMITDIAKYNNREIRVDIYNNESATNTIVIVVGGDGDDKDNIAPFAKSLSEKTPHRIVTYDSTTPIRNTLAEQLDYVEDTKVVINYCNSIVRDCELVLVCTSSGSIATTLCLIDSTLEQYISTAIYLDPANYFITEEGRSITNDTWRGKEEFKPKFPVLSSKMSEITGEVVVHVIPFTIRNSTGDSYLEKEKRGIDNPGFYPRINTESIKHFYTSTPDKNKGEYKEVNTIPHAFLRDGNVKQNLEQLTDLTKDLISTIFKLL